MRLAQVVIVMGVSGCGKSTIGAELAEQLQWSFYDGDAFHPVANIEKMTRGVPLTDGDRRPWLQMLHQKIAACLALGESAVFACSALKQYYRDQLKGDLQTVKVVYLHGSFPLIQARLEQRENHFMKAELLKSQFASLEEPQDAIVVEIDQDLAAIVAEIIQQIV
ncbi:MAG: gluconokinase [Cyanobacteria bacterium P01_G01_bin.54]